MLYRMAGALSVNYSYFFDGYNNDCLREDSVPVYEFGGGRKRETTELLRGYYKISDLAVRKKLSELIKSLALSEERVSL